MAKPCASVGGAEAYVQTASRAVAVSKDSLCLCLGCRIERMTSQRQMTVLKPCALLSGRRTKKRGVAFAPVHGSRHPQYDARLSTDPRPGADELLAKRRGQKPSERDATSESVGCPIMTAAQPGLHSGLPRGVVVLVGLRCCLRVRRIMQLSAPSSRRMHRAIHRAPLHHLHAITH